MNELYVCKVGELDDGRVRIVGEPGHRIGVMLHDGSISLISIAARIRVARPARGCGSRRFRTSSTTHGGCLSASATTSPDLQFGMSVARLRVPHQDRRAYLQFRSRSSGSTPPSSGKVVSMSQY